MRALHWRQNLAVAVVLILTLLLVGVLALGAIRLGVTVPKPSRVFRSPSRSTV
jgi:hypothetical protein